MSLIRKTLRRGATAARRVGKATMNMEKRGENVVRKIGKASRKTLRRGTNTLGITKRRKRTQHRRRR